MASSIHQYTASIPANTQQNALATVKLAVPMEVNLSVDLEVPPGPAGLMGFYLAFSGVQVIPMEVGQFIVWDDYRDSWALDDYPVTGAWSVVGYNLDDAFAHEVIVRFHDQPLTPAAVVVPSITIVSSPVGDSITL